MSVKSVLKVSISVLSLSVAIASAPAAFANGAAVATAVATDVATALKGDAGIATVNGILQAVQSDRLALTQLNTLIKGSKINLNNSDRAALAQQIRDVLISRAEGTDSPVIQTTISRLVATGKSYAAQAVKTNATTNTAATESRVASLGARKTVVLSESQRAAAKEVKTSAATAWRASRWITDNEYQMFLKANDEHIGVGLSFLDPAGRSCWSDLGGEEVHTLVEMLIAGRGLSGEELCREMGEVNARNRNVGTQAGMSATGILASNRCQYFSKVVADACAQAGVSLLPADAGIAFAE